MTEAEQIMKRCQAGTQNYEEANNLHAACYGIIGKLLTQRTWVGLTDADWKEIEDMPDTFDQGVAWAQAKLKQKNGYAKEKNT